ncbi:preprotein translocase subunit YajC [Streptomyces xiaopingdaonensis]|uniref:preprotein translocase subunit YajC n=1 Tax=Streptomyces xiaopingdaonensis TaxID=1565415 RepID=UPI000315E14F|nr:preprotein translocase subunit YajC [Streptomyces xiaopingdaonensis]
MDPIALLPFIVLIGAMYLMTRSAKKKQRQATQMRDQMQPGTGVRTIGGMYATVKEIRDDTVLLEMDSGQHALFAKNAIGAVLEDAEYERIVNGVSQSELDVDTVVPDDASSLTEDSDRIDLHKSEEKPEESEEKAESEEGENAASGTESETADAATAEDAKPEDAKRDGDTDSK